MNSLTRIYLLRHGETVWNQERRIQGHLDSRLTDRGRRQVLANGERLARLLVDVNPAPRFISSPLGRCRETTTLICGILGIGQNDIEFDERLKEHAYGDWEGRTDAEIQAMDAQRWVARETDRWSISAPNGENYAMVADRLRSWLSAIEGQTVVAISHGCAGRILRGVYADLPKSQISELGESHEAIHLLADGKISTFLS
jgi:broad specificity phosphatase PhoE